MFHNQAVAAQNVSRMHGIMPVGGQQGQPMPNPFPAESFAPTYSQQGFKNWNYSPDIGARMAGGMGMAIPAAAGMVSLGGMFMGGRAAMMDPFTGVARAFRAGTGAAAGAGIQGTLGTIGSAFRTGGLGTGARVLGGGLAAGAAAAVPYYLAGKAISTVGENIYAGAQDVQQVGQMAQQYMDPAWGQAGSRRGGQRGRGQIRNMVNVLRDISSEDVMTDMESLKRVMDQAGRSGMLSGVQDVSQFKKRFKGIVEKTKEVAKAMGTSLEEAMPLMRQMGQMGMWTAKDIMGTTRAIQAAGPGGAQQMMGAMQTGAQQSMQMGGSARAGASLGRDLFRTMQAATRSGAISREQMFEFTGGATGAEGQRIAAQRTMGIMQKFGQTSMGQLMLAGLGETKENRRGEQVFTGRMDEERMEQFRRGELSVEQLQQRGQQVTQGSRESAASFSFNRERMGQEMLSQGGIGTMHSALQRVLEKAMPNAGENVRKMLTQKVLGVSSREVEMISKLADEQGRIRDQQARENERVINEQMRRLEERQFRSWDGLKDVIGQSWDQTVQPLRDFGADLATGLGETTDKLINTITGRTKQIAMGGQERLRLFRQSMQQKAGQAVATGADAAAGAPGGAAARPAGPVNMLQMLEMSPEQRQEFMRGVGKTAETGGARADLAAGAGVEGDQALRAITPEEAGAPNVGQKWFTPGAYERTLAGWRTGGFWGGGVPAAAGAYRGSRAEMVQTLGLRPERRVESLEGVKTSGMVAAPAQGGGYELYSTRKIQKTMEAASKRNRAPTLRNLLGKDADTDENRTRITTIQKAMRALNLDPKKKKYLQKLREDGDISTYNRELAREIAKRSGGDVAEAFRALGADLSGDPGDSEDVRNIIQIATEQGEGVSGLTLEEKDALEGLGQMSPRQLEEVQEDNLKRMQSALSGQVDEGPMGYTGGLFGRGGKARDQQVEGAGLSDDELTDVMSKYGADVVKAAQQMSEDGKISPDNALSKAAYREDFDPAARKLVEYFQRAPTSAKAFIGKVGAKEGGAKEFVQLRMFRAEKESLDRVQRVAKSQGELSKDLTADTRERLGDIQTSLSNVGSMEEYRAVMGDVETLAGKLQPKDIRKLAQGKGGTFGRMAAAMARTDEIQAMGGKDFEDVRKRISSAAGVKDITQLLDEGGKEKLQEFLQDKKIDKDEAGQLQELLKSGLKTSIGESAKDREDINKQMISSMKAYATANTMFVQVTGDVLSKLGGEESKAAVQAVLGASDSVNLKEGAK